MQPVSSRAKLPGNAPQNAVYKHCNNYERIFCGH